MTEYEFYFEGECGFVMEYIDAENLRDAVAILKERNPFDIGADGYVIYNTENDTIEQPINW